MVVSLDEWRIDCCWQGNCGEVAVSDGVLRLSARAIGRVDPSQTLPDVCWEKGIDIWGATTNDRTAKIASKKFEGRSIMNNVSDQEGQNYFVEAMSEVCNAPEVDL